MKKATAAILAALSLTAFVGCNNTNPNTAENPLDVDRNSPTEWGEQMEERAEYDKERAAQQARDMEQGIENGTEKAKEDLEELGDDIKNGAERMTGNDSPTDIDKATQDAVEKAEMNAKNNH